MGVDQRSITEKWNADKAATQQTWERLDKFDVERLRAGESLAVWGSGRFVIEQATIVTHPKSGKERVVTFHDNGSTGSFDTGYSPDYIRMAPKPQERRTIYLNVYPVGEGQSGHSSQQGADGIAGKHREGRAVPVHLVKGADGNWQVDTEAETDKA